MEHWARNAAECVIREIRAEAEERFELQAYNTT
jgi:hypothetical protein